MHALGAEENGISGHLLGETHFDSGDMISHMCGYKGLSDSTPVGLSEWGQLSDKPQMIYFLVPERRVSGESTQQCWGLEAKG